MFPWSNSMTPITLDPAERTPCEVWTRCMVYHRPVSYFNPGMRAEHQERRYFRESPLNPEPRTLNPN